MYTTSVLIFCNIILFILILITTSMCTYPNLQTYENRNETYEQLFSFCPHHYQWLDTKYKTNSFYFVAIGLQKRKQSYFDPLRQKLKEKGIYLNYFPGMTGKYISIENHPLSSSYKQYFYDHLKQLKNKTAKTNYLGHYGATLSHYYLMKNIVFLNISTPTIILEDDISLGDFEKSILSRHIEYLNFNHTDWELLLLGWSCDYKDHINCTCNDQEELKKLSTDGSKGIVKVNYWFGCWGYVLRNHLTAKSILKKITPLDWHIDISLAELAKQGKLQVFGAIPTLINHPGKLRISSHDYNQYGDTKLLRSDTNIPTVHFQLDTDS